MPREGTKTASGRVIYVGEDTFALIQHLHEQTGMRKAEIVEIAIKNSVGIIEEAAAKMISLRERVGAEVA